MDGAVPIELAVATTSAQRQRGLMCSPPLADNRGMLLAYPKPQHLAIWMKNMIFSLDILFLDRSAKVLSVHRHAPPCTEAPCALYRSEGKALYALELRAGQAAALDLHPGRQLKLQLSDPVPR
nr:DUF192 domain-containing protein [Motiliproteus sp. SC1-56]